MKQHLKKGREYLVHNLKVITVLVVLSLIGVIFLNIFETRVSGNIILGTLKEEMGVEGNEGAEAVLRAEKEREKELVAQYETEGISPKVYIGYQLKPEDLSKLNATKYHPILRVSCDQDRCLNGRYWECSNGQFVEKAECKYGCDDQGCF